ncbi:structure-specific endonuclease subunit SLX1 [Olea europaea subsp. europaea]|uniref:Structure-specific endonuclease subunit SLX1 homolog n=1 Tax=Olea europaea subsp. europaea TaxID=158383 RepID=A0A8S0PIK1_OLEEU|nr:structure-specific endonuclease subunit SLX1 [Olea europaea subsp. europaea]
MGKRKGRKDIEKTLISGEENVEEERSIIDQQDDGGEEEDEDKEGSRFFACYLLTSLCPRFKGHTYIGYTVNPRRRIRQHNGEVRSGAWRTKRKRPWEMVFCIYGFPTNVAALQFEWAWQHPVESLAVRKVAATFKSLSGIANKIKLAYTMVTLPAWNSLNLTVNFFSTKYKMYTAGSPNLPVQMRIRVCSMDELPCYTASTQNSCENEKWDGDEEFSLRGRSQESLMRAATNHQSPSHQESSRGAVTSHQFPIDQGTIPEKRRKQINQIEETCECSNCLENIWMGQQRNFPTGTSSSSVTTGLYNSVSGIEDGHTSRLVEVTTELVDHPVEKQSATAVVADKDPILMKSPRVYYEVEVIDVFTPSPCYRASSGRKKRIPNVYPEIIDLTESPICL